MVPPLDTSYQLIVSPAPGIAEIVTTPVPQREPSTAEGAEGPVMTEAVTGVLESDLQPVTISIDSA